MLLSQGHVQRSWRIVQAFVVHLCPLCRAAVPCRRRLQIDGSRDSRPRDLDLLMTQQSRERPVKLLGDKTEEKASAWQDLTRKAFADGRS